jgi:hypothetical protein
MCDRIYAPHTPPTTPLSLAFHRRAYPEGNPRQLTNEAPGTPYGLRGLFGFGSRCAGSRNELRVVLHPSDDTAL